MSYFRGIVFALALSLAHAAYGGGELLSSSYIGVCIAQLPNGNQVALRFSEPVYNGGLVLSLTQSGVNPNAPIAMDEGAEEAMPWVRTLWQGRGFDVAADGSSYILTESGPLGHSLRLDPAPASRSPLIQYVAHLRLPEVRGFGGTMGCNFVHPELLARAVGTSQFRSPFAIEGELRGPRPSVQQTVVHEFGHSRTADGGMNSAQ